MRRWPRFWLLLAVLSGVPAGVRAQNTNNTASAPSGQSAGAAVPRPTRKPDQVITDDPIGLLAVRRVPRQVATPPREPMTEPGDAGVASESADRRTAEIASLEKQIKDKQKQIALLMKLFVDDEKEFLKNGGAAEANLAAQERRRYEQDELRWETAEVAKLQARLVELKSDNRK